MKFEPVFVTVNDTDTLHMMRIYQDPQDGFNYGEAARGITLPPVLYFAALNDMSLGHPSDVMDFINESGNHAYRYVLLSRKNGNLHNYDHVAMVANRDAVNDHFPDVLR